MKSYPTEKQIKYLRELPTQIACDAAEQFSQSMILQIQQLSKKMLLLTEIMAELYVKLPAPQPQPKLVKKDV